MGIILKLRGEPHVLSVTDWDHVKFLLKYYYKKAKIIKSAFCLIEPMRIISCMVKMMPRF